MRDKEFSFERIQLEDSVPAVFKQERPRRKPVAIADKQVIAWDTEGMSLSGDDKPQHPVIFGCSAADPLIGWDLQTLDMLNHILLVDQLNPKALHVGYGWRYDANMIVKDLPAGKLIRLYKTGRISFDAEGFTYRLRWIPGKWFTVSRHRPGKRRTRHYDTGESQSVTIYDYSSFFGGSAFLATCENILKDSLSPADRDVIAKGKQQRGSNSWDDLPEVLHYWQLEIQLIRRVMERFRDVMIKAGFSLKEWYGPGALANYIIAARNMRPHLAGAQSTSGLMPLEVHEASKYAFAGGRFEPFRVGRIPGPIHVYDINSAYPFALTQIPSLQDGEWVRVENPTEVERFGVYRVDFIAPGASPIEYRPMPLFKRDPRGLISFPQLVSGWYMSPEVRTVLGQPGVSVPEGWVWRSGNDYPWEFLADMYETRQRIGKDNLLSLPFKLGPNSLYGKLAQTVGWDTKKRLPPRSHALLIAAWVTSYCRALLWAGIQRSPHDLIAVETDSIITTAPPEVMRLSTGDALGEWSHKEYDEILYVQSGMYHARKGDDWVVSKARGLDRADISAADMSRWLASLKPDDWQALEVLTKPRFIGIGYALQSHKPLKDYHRVWERQKRLITLGDNGKRVHIGMTCQCCADGLSPYDQAHPLAISLSIGFEAQSSQRRLPWEQEQTPEVTLIRDQLTAERDLLL